MQVLYTHKLPCRNTTVICVFCKRLVCNPHTSFIGKAKIAKSVKILGTAFPMKEPFRLIQWPGKAGFQVFRIGVHWKIETMMMEMHHAIEIAPRITAPTRIVRTGKMRQYINRMEILVKQMQVTYRHSKEMRDCRALANHVVEDELMGRKSYLCIGHDLVIGQGSHVPSHAIVYPDHTSCEGGKEPKLHNRQSIHSSSL